MVGGVVNGRQPPLTPPYQGGESFSWEVVSRRIMTSSLRMTAPQPAGCNFDYDFPGPIFDFPISSFHLLVGEQ